MTCPGGINVAAPALTQQLNLTLSAMTLSATNDNWQ